MSSTHASSSATSPFVSGLMSPPQSQAISTMSPVETPSSSTANLSTLVAPNMPTGTDIRYEPPEGMSRVYRSGIWEHFNTYWKKSVIYVNNPETKKQDKIISWKMRAKCMYCPKGNNNGDYACDGKDNGTSGLNRHIKNYCKYYPGNKDIKKQKVLSKDDWNQLTSRGFDQKDVMEACVEMVVLDELPFSFVEKKGFRKFCSIGLPLFKVPSRRTLVRTFLDMYEARKMKVKKELKSHRICLTTDTWTSLQNYNYMVLTAHYIDSDWKMHKRVLNFCLITNHQGSTIADLIDQCLSDWGIDKVMTITVDNASANDTALECLQEKFKDCDSTTNAILDAKHIHVRCVAHITNLIVGNGLKKLSPTILAIRNAVKFVRSSPARLEYFKNFVTREKLPYKGLVCLDIKTRWNSTFLMLQSCLRLKKAFRRMEQDTRGPYIAYFGEDEEVFDDEGNAIVVNKGKKKVGPPIEKDWAMCDVFVNLLKVFYEITLRVSSSTRPTINTAVHDIIAIEQAMNKLLYVPGNEQFGGIDLLMAEIGTLMKSKYNKYFRGFRKLNPFVILGLILDPRFKMRNLEHVLSKSLNWQDFEVEKKKKEILNMMFALYDEYVDKQEDAIHMGKRTRDVTTTSSMQSNVKRHKSINRDVCSGTLAGVLDEWGKIVEETDEAVITHEINRFLTDPLEKVRRKELGEDDDSREFDLLQWWKLACDKYPILGLIARDVFAIQVSTVASESAFSTGGRIVDAFRCSLTPTSVEALICMQNWLSGDDIITHFEDEPCVDELEFYEGIETELENAKAGTFGTNDDEVEDLTTPV